MSELHDSVNYYNLKFIAIKNSQIKSSEVKNKQNGSLNKLNNVKIGKKLMNSMICLIILKNVTILEKKLLIFLKTILKCYLTLITM